MSNGKKWLLILALGFGTGAATALANEQNATAKSIVLHGLFGLLPSAIALKTKLETSEQTADRKENEARAKAAGA